MWYKLLFFVSIILIGSSLSSNLPFISGENKEAKIDSLFATWNGTDVAGGTVAVVREGEIVFSKAYGMASLEYGVPNRVETIYNLASVSKQFTAYGMVLLEQQGKLSLEDDVRKYLPDVPDFGERITIRQMLTHTSGLRSLHALLEMAGWRGDDRRSNADLRRFIANQKELNFPSGSEYLYCNTGYMFCADIIEQISGMSYESWMKENVFDPLGMSQSFCRRDINQVIPHVATSYYGPANNEFQKAVEYWAYVGSGNMHSTVADLSVWMKQFRQPNSAFKRLQENGILTNGDTIPYALGNIVSTHRGAKVIHHGGSIGGFRSFFLFFPEYDIGFIVLSNRSSGNAGGKAFQLAHLYLSDHLEPVSSSSPGQAEQSSSWEPSESDKTGMLGRYYSPELDTYYRIDWSSDDGYSLYHQRHGSRPVQGGQEDELRNPSFRFQLVRGKRNRIIGARASNGRVRNMWFEKVGEKYDPAKTRLK
ncbi:MAG: serine hydrolase domain-containing protein [Bacteroidota bacterium]